VSWDGHVQDIQPMHVMLGRIWHHIGARRRFQLGALFFMMAVAAFAEIATIGAVLPFLAVLTEPRSVFDHAMAKPLIELFGISAPRQLLAPLTLVFAVSAVLSGGMRLVLLWCQTRLSQSIGADVSSDIYRRTLYQPYVVHTARNSSEVIAGILAKSTVVVGQTIIPCLTMLSSGLMLAGILIMLIAIDPLIAITAFAGFGGIYIFVILLTKRCLARDSERINHEQIQVVKVLQEGLGGIRNVLIDGAQKSYCKAYSNADVPLRRALASIQFISASPRFAIEALGMVLIAILAFSLADQEGGVAGAVPILGALALGAQRLLPLLQQGYAGWTTMRGSQASLRDALDLLDQPLPAHANEPLPAPIPFNRSIDLNNLSFRYTSDGPIILNVLELSITKGARVGFIGATGSGKSTMIDVVMGLLQATDGSMTVDGVHIDEHNHRAWQVHIAHVPQAIFLSDASIAENIAFGIPANEINLERVREAARKAQIASTIEDWELHYNTIVGERGVRLSGGQRQRIGIARALYKQADVIVLDEATSALDNDTERAVMESIEGLGGDLTILLVAHRLTTLKNCTQIVELSNGRVLRSGTYSEIVGNTAA
jgi:ABC-type bacteriocin/lantibiotic exporter with double-glycine peptidase domain